MKVPKPSLILNSLVYQPPLPQLTADETERSLKYAEENGNVDTSKNSEKLTADVFRYAQPCGAHLPVSPKSGTAAFFKTPVHMGRLFPGGATVGNTGSFRMKGSRTPRMVAPTLINLSFSQPNSPRTPRPHSRLATPVYMSTALSHRQSQENVLNTPCVAEALHVLQLAQDTGLPDFLTWIVLDERNTTQEDDKTGLSQVERQLLRNTDVELTDQNVVDYLLEMAQEEPGTAACSGSDAEAHFPPPPLLHPLHPPPQLWHQPYSPPRLQSRDDPLPLLETDDGLNVRRKRRRRTYEKRMTSEEARVIRKQRATRAARAQQAADRDGPTRSLRWSETLPQQPPPVAAAAAVVAEACSSDVAVLSVTPPSSPVKPRSTPVRPRSPFMKRRSKRNIRQVARFEVHW